MSTFLISYDLGGPETSSDYAELIKAIKAYGPWAKPPYSVWLIETTSTAAQVRDNLSRHLDSNDKLLVLTAAAPAAWLNLPDDVDSWLVSNL